MDISPGSTPTEESAVRNFTQMASAGHASTSSAAANSVISQMAQVAASANDSSPSILAALPQLIAQMSGGEGGSNANGYRFCVAVCFIFNYMSKGVLKIPPHGPKWILQFSQLV